MLLESGASASGAAGGVSERLMTAMKKPPVSCMCGSTRMHRSMFIAISCSGGGANIDGSNRFVNQPLHAAVLG